MWMILCLLCSIIVVGVVFCWIEKIRDHILLDCDEYLVVMNGCVGCVECSMNGIFFVSYVVEMLLVCGVVLLGLIDNRL